MESEDEWKKIFKVLNQSPKTKDSSPDETQSNSVSDEASAIQRQTTEVLWINGIFSLDLETFRMKYVWVSLYVQRGTPRGWASGGGALAWSTRTNTTKRLQLVQIFLHFNTFPPSVLREQDSDKEEIAVNSPFWRKAYPRQRPYQ